MVFPQQKTSKAFIVALLFCFLVVGISAKVVRINVGGKQKPNHPEKLKFDPQNVTAVKGDIIKWVFKGGNHDVVQSEGLASCGAGSKKVDGFTSETNPPEKQFNITIANDQDIIYYMCMVGNHCESGMWGAIYVGGTEPFPIVNKKHEKKPHGHHIHLKPGQIAGIAIGGVAGLALFSVLGFFGFRRYKSKRSLQQTTPEQAQFMKGSYSGSTEILKSSTKTDNV